MTDSMRVPLETHKRLFLLFSHQLTEEQSRDAIRNMKVSNFIPLPLSLQRKWSQVPPACRDIGAYAEELLSWLAAHANKGDYVLVQGEAGLVYLTVQYCKYLGLIPIYATTNRVCQEKVLDNGEVVSTRVFKHQGFRQFPAL